MWGLKLYLSPLISRGHLSPLSLIGPGMNWPGLMTCRKDRHSAGVSAADHAWSLDASSIIASSCQVPSCRVQLPWGGRLQAGCPAAYPQQAHLDPLLAESSIKESPGVECCLASLRVCIFDQDGSEQQHSRVSSDTGKDNKSNAEHKYNMYKPVRGEYAPLQPVNAATCRQAHKGSSAKHNTAYTSSAVESDCQ